MSQDSVKIQALLEWSESNGSSLNASVEIYEDPVTGLSFLAKGDLEPSTKLVEVTYDTTLSFLNAIDASSCHNRHESELFPSSFLSSLSEDDPNIIGHFFLIQQYLLGKKSFWWHYIRLLPQPNEPERLDIPIWWPEEDQRFLDGTNAEPPIKKRKGLWETEWKQGIILLKDEFRDWDQYTYILYQWAATIFGSRSFRPSLTISEEAFHDQHPGSSLVKEHIRNDKFSILLPVLDIGNHNGTNDVAWAHSKNSFGILSQSPVTKGCQIYNFYGDKSNSELLVGYGFILPDTEKDRVNLKITPPREKQILRRTQHCHRADPKQLEQEFMFQVRSQTRSRGGEDQRVNTCEGPLQFFSEGLFDTTICMVANTREQQYITKNPNCCPENDPSVFQGPLARSAYQVLKVLKAKIEYEISRMDSTQPSTPPKTSNQILAHNYRTRHLSLLQSTLPPISQQLHALTSQHVSLVSAFQFLQYHYPDWSLKLTTLISTDQEEPLPLNWQVLVEDWDHTYWIVWLYLIFSMQQSDPATFDKKHPGLAKWFMEMRGFEEGNSGVLFVEDSEVETLELMISCVNEKFAGGEDEYNRRRNFASWVVGEECIRGVVNGVEQDLLCLPGGF